MKKDEKPEKKSEKSAAVWLERKLPRTWRVYPLGYVSLGDVLAVRVQTRIKELERHPR